MLIPIIEQGLTSFIASLLFGLIFNAPKNMLIPCGTVGMLSWLIYFVIEPGYQAVSATLAATVVIGVMSQFFARKYKQPVIIFSVAGIIPLVPGGLSYNAMRYFVQNDYSTAVEHAAKALILAGTIAVGLVLSEVLNQAFRRKVKS
ncbi:threonine/serine exporter family protein [Paenibacillus gallinarum]|uniref:Threonine/serine exporter family protein n=1 Tax=Paenibacillus gallinarum TaxID=2762232 RepID=A0ABR8SSZ9_9BACL|nr:threonine/serine exporter family protein [Paenibacillus gallinarum]MBD7966616.1 threonine/serine exporter family protein [Paenibacillus gallinarum]